MGLFKEFIRYLIVEEDWDDVVKVCVIFWWVIVIDVYSFKVDSDFLIYLFLEYFIKI